MQVARKRRPQIYSLVTVSDGPPLSPKAVRRASRRSAVQPKTATILLRCTSTNSVMPAFLRARRNPLPMTLLPWMKCPPLCARTITRKLKSLKKKMAQISSVKNTSKRENLLHEANALLASFGDAVNKKNKKTKIDDEEGEEAGLAEVLVAAHATSDAAHASDMPISSPKPKPKKKKAAQVDELERTLARCTVQRFAGCSVPSNFTL